MERNGTLNVSLNIGPLFLHFSASGNSQGAIDNRIEQAMVSTNL